MQIGEDIIFTIPKTREIQYLMIILNPCPLWYLDLVVHDERSQLLLQTRDAAPESLCHGGEVHAEEGRCILNQSSLPDLGVKALQMVVQVDVELQLRLQLRQVSQAGCVSAIIPDEGRKRHCQCQIVS